MRFYSLVSGNCSKLVVSIHYPSSPLIFLLYISLSCHRQKTASFGFVTLYAKSNAQPRRHPARSPPWISRSNGHDDTWYLARRPHVCFFHGHEVGDLLLSNFWIEFSRRATRRLLPASSPKYIILKKSQLPTWHLLFFFSVPFLASAFISIPFLVFIFSFLFFLLLLLNVES